MNMEADSDSRVLGLRLFSEDQEVAQVGLSYNEVANLVLQGKKWLEARSS